MTPFMRDIAEWLQAQGLEQMRPQGERLMGGPFQGQSGAWRLYVWSPDRDRVVFLSVLIPLIPPSRRAAVGELLHRVNRRLTEGAFDLDMDSGEVRCRTTAIPLGHEPWDRFLEAALLSNVVATDRFLPAVEDVLFDRRPPAEAARAAALAPDPEPA